MKQFKIRCSQIGKIMGNGKGGELSQTCKTYLHEWYAEDNEPIHSKYLDKGIWVENDLIDFAVEQLGYGIGSKNMFSAENDYITGTCDVLFDDCVIDTKACWDRKSLHDIATSKIDSDYEWQVLGYLEIYNRKKGIVFHGLLNTPAEINYGLEMVFEGEGDQDKERRWVGFNVPYNPEKIQQIYAKVDECRKYLDEYDNLIKSKLGKVL